jgi:hypothetical protein
MHLKGTGPARASTLFRPLFRAQTWGHVIILQSKFLVWELTFVKHSPSCQAVRPCGTMPDPRRLEDQVPGADLRKLGSVSV